MMKSPIQHIAPKHLGPTWVCLHPAGSEIFNNTNPNTCTFLSIEDDKPLQYSTVLQTTVSCFLSGVRAFKRLQCFGRYCNHKSREEDPVVQRTVPNGYNEK
jgi:hypothetical protein